MAAGRAGCVGGKWVGSPGLGLGLEGLYSRQRYREIRQFGRRVGRVGPRVAAPAGICDTAWRRMGLADAAAPAGRV